MRKPKGMTAAAEKPVAMADLSPITELDLSHIQVDDGKPVDNIFSERQMRLLTESLYSSWRDAEGNPKVFAAFANVGLFYGLHDPPVVPDVMVTLGVKPKPLTSDKSTLSYFIWEYGGKAPDIVIEIVSNREDGEDTTKMLRYAAIGVAYYIIYDPMQKLSRRPLRVYEKHGSAFVEYLDALALPGMGLGLGLWNGEYEGFQDQWLRWFDDRKQMLLTGLELAAQARQSEQQARQSEAQARQSEAQARQSEEQARQTAVQAQVATQAAQGRAERLAAKLRELGIDEP